MLYISSRNKTESYTAYRTLHNDYAPDGGMFVPFRIPTFDEEELLLLREKTFGQTVAQILNLFFSSRLSGWDVECCIGRNPIRLENMSHRLIVAESWHNPDGQYTYIENSLYSKIAGLDTSAKPTQWPAIAIRVAVLFGIYSGLPGLDSSKFDLAVTTGDFSAPIAAWYARKMGLPVGTIICSCNDNSGAWDLIHRGEFYTNAGAVVTGMPELDIARPEGLERLIFGTLGIKENLRYLSACSKGGIYHLNEDALSKLNAGMSAAVVSKDRVSTIIRSVFRTNNYIIDPHTAFSYGGLQDYRACTGESRFTLLLADYSPILASDAVTAAVGINQDELAKRLNTIKE